MNINLIIIEIQHECNRDEIEDIHFDVLRKISFLPRKNKSGFSVGTAYCLIHDDAQNGSLFVC